MKFAQLKCFDKENKRVYSVVSFDTKKQEVTVNGYLVKDPKDTPQWITYTLPFSRVEMISYTGRVDRDNRGIFEGDEIEYNFDVFKKIQPKGFVYWNERQLTWAVDNPEMKCRVDLRELESAFIKVVGSKYGGYYCGS